MKQVPDRKKLRREYLRKKGGAAVGIALSGLLILPLSLAFTLCLIMTLVFAFSRGEDLMVRLVGGGILFALTCVAGVGMRMCIRDICETKRKASEVPYVPPITPDTLPVEEILVRGSEEPPVVQSKVLLRAAHKAQETAKEMLLRVSQE